MDLSTTHVTYSLQAACIALCTGSRKLCHRIGLSRSLPTCQLMVTVIMMVMVMVVVILLTPPLRGRQDDSVDHMMVEVMIAR